MKKLFLVLLAVALVGSFAFAEVTGVDAPTLSGSVTTQFGINLDEDNATGFDNSSSVDVVVPLAGGSETHAGSGGAYAEITIDEIEISTSTDDGDWEWDADVSAKIVVGDMYVGLGKPDLTFNNVDLDADAESDGDADDDVSIDVNCKVAGADGISVGYATDAFSIEVGVASKNDNFQGAAGAETLVPKDGTTSWLDSNETDEDSADAAVVPNSDNAYVFGLNGSVTAGPATVPFYFAYDAEFSGTDAMIGVGAAPSIAAGDLAIDIPVDYVMLGDMSGLEAKPELSYAIAGVGTLAVDFFFASYTDIVVQTKEDDPSTADVDESAYFTAPESIMDLGFKFTEDFMDELTLVIDFDLTHLADDGTDVGWNVNFDASYDVGAAAPYLTLDYGSNEDMDLSVGAKFATMIDNAVVKVDYTNGHLLESGSTADGNLKEAKKGSVTLEVAVTF